MPSIFRRLAGVPRSLYKNVSMWVDSGWWLKKSKKRLGSCWLVTGLGLRLCTMSGNFIASRMKNTGKLLPTRSQLPSSVKNLTAKPRGSRSCSGLPPGWITVEKRTNTGVALPSSANSLALVSLDNSPLATNSPNAPTPRAWTTRSGMRSRSKRASFWSS